MAAVIASIQSKQVVDHLHKLVHWIKSGEFDVDAFETEAVLAGGDVCNYSFTIKGYFEDSPLQLLLDIEQWEADMLNDPTVWNTNDGLPHWTQDIYDRWMKLQARRNKLVKRLRECVDRRRM